MPMGLEVSSTQSPTLLLEGDPTTCHFGLWTILIYLASARIHERYEPTGLGKVRYDDRGRSVH